MKNKKLIEIDTVALLKHKDCDFELHLNGRRKFFPLNMFQQFLYWMLRFEYIEGVDYIELMKKRFKSKDYRGMKINENQNN